MSKSIVVDTNTMLILVAGTVDVNSLGREKGLKEYHPATFGVVASWLFAYPEIILIPNIITETSNLINSFRTGFRDSCKITLAALVSAQKESYVPSKFAINDDQYLKFGITDCAILSLLNAETDLITADQPLCFEASSRGHTVIYLPEII